ncbi:MAG: hypothetical protein QM703_05390 [Gemmatales bacterium]
MRSVPFTITSLFAGLGQCHGIVYDEEDSLRFEFQIKDSISGILKSGVKQVRIPVQQIISVDLVKGWLGSVRAGVKIILQGALLDSLKELPGMNQGKIELCISKANAALAQEFVEGLYSV